MKDRMQRLEEFLKVTKLMRSAQRQYFRTRNPRDLIEARRMEDAVDRRLRALVDQCGMRLPHRMSLTPGSSLPKAGQ